MNTARSPSETRRDNALMGRNLLTPLCQELGIQYPIFSVGFGSGAVPELVAAVSNAGGFGVLGSEIPRDEMQRRIRRVRGLTDLPFGVNFIIQDEEEEDRAFFLDEVAAVVAERVAAVVLFWGDPAPYIKNAHSNGVKIFIQVGSVEEAKAAADVGVDAVMLRFSIGRKTPSRSW